MAEHDLTTALREAGHADLADVLERKELAGRLRQAGRDDVADRLEAPEAPEAPPAAPEPSKSAERVAGEALLEHLNSSVSRWHSIGGDGR